MSLTVQTNIASLIAQTNLNINNEFMQQTIQRLTSGYRINSSADDAAGLVIANQYRSNVAELTQGIRNANDGVSTLQIIDGGLNNISTMLDRLKTLATESASGTFTGSRATLDAEYQTLLGEINRQASNIGLSNTNAVNSVQLNVYVGGGQNATTGSTVQVNLAGSHVDSGGLGLTGTNVAAAAPVEIGTTVNGVIANGATESFTVNTAAGTATVSVVGAANDTAATQVGELNSALGAYGISASIDSNGKLAFSSANAFGLSITGAGLATGGEHGINTDLNNAAVVYNNADNPLTFTVTQGATTATVNVATGLTDTAALASINAQLSAQGVGVAAVADGSGVAHHFSLQGANTFTTNVSAGASTIAATVAAAGGGNGATNAINAINAAITALGKVQGSVGAGENKLQYAINLASSQITSFSAAQSRIRDADMAAEAANLTKAQILQQSSIAAMAQANSAPQSVLALLK